MSESFRVYTCPKCGYTAWALDNVFVAECKKCKTIVKTEPMPVVEDEKSNVCNYKKRR